MNRFLPESTRELRLTLARLLGLVAVLVGLAAGIISFRLETSRAEQEASDRVAEALRHFEPPTMQLLAKAAIKIGHEPLDALADSGHMAGIRVFSPEGKLFYEKWKGISAADLDSINAQRYDWPSSRETVQGWIEIPGARLIRVVQAIVDGHGGTVGYLEGISRLDAKTLKAQHDRIRNGVLTAVVSVLATALFLYPLLLAMLRRSTRLTRDLLDSNLSLVRSLGNAVAERDSDTNAHNYRVTYYAVALAEALGLPEREIAELLVGAFLHDIGKIGVPDSILLKPDRLTATEFAIMKTHTQLGVGIIADSPWLQSALPVVRSHHERFDGGGYPDGLQGEAIPYRARIFAIVDVFDAMTSARPYKEPLALADVLSSIKEDAGRHFDPHIVSVFLQIAPSMHAIANLASEDELRQIMNAVLAKYFRQESAIDHLPADASAG